MVFVGYGESDGVKGWKMFDLATQKVKISCDVTFPKKTIFTSVQGTMETHLDTSLYSPSPYLPQSASSDDTSNLDPGTPYTVSDPTDDYYDEYFDAELTNEHDVVDHTHAVLRQAIVPLNGGSESSETIPHKASVTLPVINPSTSPTSTASSPTASAEITAQNILPSRLRSGAMLLNARASRLEADGTADEYLRQQFPVIAMRAQMYSDDPKKIFKKSRIVQTKDIASPPWIPSQT